MTKIYEDILDDLDSIGTSKTASQQIVDEIGRDDDITYKWTDVSPRHGLYQYCFEWNFQYITRGKFNYQQIIDAFVPQLREFANECPLFIDQPTKICIEIPGEEQGFKGMTWTQNPNELFILFAFNVPDNPDPRTVMRMLCWWYHIHTTARRFSHILCQASMDEAHMINGVNSDYWFTIFTEFTPAYRFDKLCAYGDDRTNMFIKILSLMITKRRSRFPRIVTKFVKRSMNQIKLH